MWIHFPQYLLKEMLKFKKKNRCPIEIVRTIRFPCNFTHSDIYISLGSGANMNKIRSNLRRHRSKDGYNFEKL